MHIPFFLQKSSKVIFCWIVSSPNFEGKICYELKINYFAPKIEGCTVYYSCMLMFWSRQGSCSHPLGFSWLCWALEATIVFIWMTEKLNSNWRSKNLTVMTSTLWRSKIRGNILGCVPREFSMIVSCFIKWVFWSWEATIFEVLCDRPTGHFLSHCVMALFFVKTLF